MKINKLFLRLIFILFFLIFINFLGESLVNAQDETFQPLQHPKIGLALGGGSAGGFAHIGVLKWLEENHIPVDYITGTSMGGLMGGCYAMGMTPEDIQKLAESIDWNEFFNPQVPYDSLDFRRKEDSQENLLWGGIGFHNHTISLARGLSIYQVDLVLSRVTLQYSMVKNFDELPIPFRCMATDIRKCKPVALDSGSLEKALRATMSIPAVFPPVEYNGQLLVDGGILNNLPVEEVKKMGADVVIAVNITAPTQTQNEDIGSVLSRTLDTVTTSNVTPSASLANILLEPSLAELGLLKFDAVERYVELGYQAAEKQKDILRKYSLEGAAWQQYLRVRKKRCLTDIPVPSDIEVSGVTAINAAAIKKCLQPYIGKPVNKELLEKDLTALMGSGLYDSLSYEFVLRDGKPVLAVTAQEKTNGPPFISFHAQSFFNQDNTRMNLSTRMTSLNDTGPGSEVRFDLGIGTEPNLSLELYQPLSNSKWFFAPSVYGKQENRSLFQTDTRVTDYQITDYGIACDLGYAFNKFSEGRLGYVNGFQDTHLKIGEPLGADYDGQVQMAKLKWSFYSGDDAYFPRKGLNIDSNARWYFEAPDDDSREFGLIENKIRWNIPAGQDDSIFVFLAGGSSSRNDVPLPQQFKLGGFFKLSAYGYDEFHGDNYLLGTIGFLKCVAKLPPNKNIYLGVWMENGGVYEKLSDLDTKMDLSAGLLTSTVLGPVFIAASYGENSNMVYYMGLGYLFNN
jgi:NTE family protein